MSKTTTAYFNEGAINLARPLSLIREAQSPGEFRLVCSSSRRRARLTALSDEFAYEPIGLSDADYVAWCLQFARSQGADIMVAGRRANVLAQSRHQFENLGVRLLCVADAINLDVLSNKLRTYERLAKLPINIPAYAAAGDLAGFDAALKHFANCPDVCFKPAVSIYGLGFRILAKTPHWQRQLRQGHLHAEDLIGARRRLAALPRFQELIVMEYLPGPERSVDCLARHGQLLRCVVRKKPQRAGCPQVIQRHQKIETAVQEITRELNLHGVFNVQFRDSGGQPFLLEINPRMSGGLRHSAQAGVALPYWMLRLEVGDVAIDEIPHPQIGAQVGGHIVTTSF